MEREKFNEFVEFLGLEVNELIHLLIHSYYSPVGKKCSECQWNIDDYKIKCHDCWNDYFDNNLEWI